jgi:hypothetical protein
MTDLDREFTNKEQKFFDSLGNKTRPNLGNTTSQDTAVLDKYEMRGLRKFFQEQIDNYMNDIVCPIHTVNLRITQSWLNFSHKGESHHQHSHPNSYISAVFYAKTNPDDKIYFVSPNHHPFSGDMMQLQIPTEKFNSYNSKTWWMPASKYRLYLFPSTLRHYVDPVQGDDVRISMSFNTFPVGMLGQEESLTLLNL